ncbi:MAG: hypothetical protein Q9M13_10165, partial [Mariprofundales bacterium]|nr:hypothetical protein [Mariprofundales bacterium]
MGAQTKGLKPEMTTLYGAIITKSSATIQLPPAKQMELFRSPDLFKFKEKTRSLLLHMSMFDAETGQITG